MASTVDGVVREEAVRDVKVEGDMKGEVTPPDSEGGDEGGVSERRGGGGGSYELWREIWKGG